MGREACREDAKNSIRLGKTCKSGALVTGGTIITILETECTILVFIPDLSDSPPVTPCLRPRKLQVASD